MENKITNNHIFIDQAEQYIKIGIKGKKIVSVDWHDLIKINPNIKDPRKKVKKYLTKAIKFLKEIKKTKVIM